MPRKRALDDETVLDRATSVFWRRGYAATSLRDLTEATGLSSAALYHRFNDKEGLFLESLRRYADQGLTDRFARLSALGSPVSAIRTFFDELIDMSADDPDRLGCFLVNTVLDGAATSFAASALARERLGEVEAFFRSSLQRASKAALIEATIKPAAMAEILLGTVLAIRVLARLDPDRTRLCRLADNALLPLIRQARARP
ncbi:MAG: TetR/AcrR family transcriptional regulator [Rhodospirillales bacterium]|nr:TetR/AcrR family transcriptional regulator [Rhodospirillales bacterium]